MLYKIYTWPESQEIMERPDAIFIPEGFGDAAYAVPVRVSVFVNPNSADTKAVLHFTEQDPVVLLREDFEKYYDEEDVESYMEEYELNSTV